MSGICGVLRLGQEPGRIPDEILPPMLDALVHRGRRRETYEGEGVQLGVRSSRTGGAEGGQPVQSEDGRIVAVADGGILNRAELRSKLVRAGHRAGAGSEIELIPHLYEEHGPSFPKSVRGEFAFAVWDGHRRRLVLARDRIGAKPLYYAERGDLLLFASELKSLLASGLIDPRLDYEWIDAYLELGFVPGPHTPLAAVSRLSPAHFLLADGGGIRLERYWAYPEPAPEPPPWDVDEHAERLIAELEETIRVRLLRGGPVGTLLSGGLDSSVILALVARNTPERVKTFSVGFREAGRANELADARWVANVFGTDHHELELSLAHDSSALTELIWCLDEPLADLGSLGLHALAKVAGEHIAIAFAGEGADCLLGGLPGHRAAAVAAACQRLPGPATRSGAWLLAHGPARFRRVAHILRAASPAERYVASGARLDRDGRSRLVRGGLAAHGGAARRALLEYQGDLVAGPLESYLYLDQQLVDVDGGLPILDRVSTAGSFESNVPFYDHHVMEHVAKIPSRLKLRGLTGKYVLKHAARDLLPARTIDKPKVGFLYDSLAAWLQAQASGPVADYLLAPTPGYADFLDRAEVKRIIDDNATNGAHSSLLLSLLVLEIWLTDFLPRALPARARKSPSAFASNG